VFAVSHPHYSYAEAPPPNPTYRLTGLGLAHSFLNGVGEDTPRVVDEAERRGCRRRPRRRRWGDRPLGEKAADWVGKAGYHVLAIERVVDAKRCGRLVARMPDVHALVAGPDDPHEARPEGEVGSGLRLHARRELVLRGHVNSKIRGKLWRSFLTLRTAEAVGFLLPPG